MMAADSFVHFLFRPCFILLQKKVYNVINIFELFVVRTFKFMKYKCYPPILF